MDRAKSWPVTLLYWLEGKNKLCFRMINVIIWRSSFNSLFCYMFPWEDLISLHLSSSPKARPVFHRDAEWISTPWKEINLWDAQSTQHPCQPRRPQRWGAMASGYHRDCFACFWNSVSQPGSEATSPSQAVKSSWKWAIPSCKTQPAPSCISGASTAAQGEMLWEACASA